MSDYEKSLPGLVLCPNHPLLLPMLSLSSASSWNHARSSTGFVVFDHEAHRAVLEMFKNMNVVVLSKAIKV